MASLTCNDTDFLTRAANMMATLELMKEKYGGAEGYVTGQCGLTKEEVALIRKNLVLNDRFP
jgi:hypothetical protein